MSVKIDRILIATDGSENVKNAVDWGIELAKRHDAKVNALYVVPPSGISLAMRGEMWARGLHEHLKEEGGKAVEHVSNLGKKEGVEVESEIIEDRDPADAIVDFAYENNIDLIVMGTLGRTGLDHILLGSVAENVVRHSKKQVLVVPVK
ncbi:universal stress protein [Methanolobus zinderi]|jgi:nucleotide-binding universal stress UspA family protein|uniref:Universal stress protein n=1 Tax=Methanolobus zinderi TaxID=536044 RepID=A0A7D5E5A7_9EURY|nr:universal stress protein [Methanolobus zinderi]KXS42740.1 MAG: universal stress protein UspA-like protein [Methanolobus sp. T82-4]QLC48952.1 universal stress protein [Methanolobus zinderi]